MGDAFYIPLHEAIEIACIAKELETDSVLDSTGYYVVGEANGESVAVDISKMDNKYAIYVSPSDDDGEWEYTETDEIEELAELIRNIGSDFVLEKEKEKTEMRRVIIGNGNYQNDGSVIIPLNGDDDRMMEQIKEALRMNPDKLIVDLATARKKKKYHVVMQTTEYYGIDVEAYDQTEAVAIAANTECGCFDFEDSTGWEFSDAWRVEK